jgi:FkbH-like protein
VCSKNDHKIAQEPFIKHTDMTLKLDDITVFIANFNDKPSNIRKISEIINLGLDSFVFIDDSPVECELVKKELPEVLVINLTDDPSEFIKKIELISPFYFKNITEEDINRNISYKKISIIKNQRLESTNLEKFLKELKPEIFFEKLDKKNIERSSQLIAKTNQFKFNSNLYSSTELLEIKNKMVSIIRFKDKIQNYGIISVLIFRIDNKSKTLNIENWVMSCRVFSRQIEHYVLNYLVQKAIENQCNMIGFKFEKTKKNLYLQTFLQEIGVKLNKNEGFYHIKLNNITNKIKNYSSFY